MFGMASAGRPLHRMTPFRDDPAAAWLSTGEKLWLDALGWLCWATFVATMLVLRIVTRVFAALLVGPFLAGRVSYMTVGALSAALVWPVRRSILRMKVGRTEEILRRSADAVAMEDWEALAGEADGKLVTVYGWVRARARLDHPVGRETAVGVGLPCQDKFPGVFESLHDFDLVDEAGRSIFIRVDGGRMYGAPNVALDGHELRHLFAALGVPSGATASSWQVHALREGDPVMVVGFKQAEADPLVPSLREPVRSLALGSSASHPLLVFTIPAERRAV
jgi:hypothetical protein